MEQKDGFSTLRTFQMRIFMGESGKRRANQHGLLRHHSIISTSLTTNLATLLNIHSQQGLFELAHNLLMAHSPYSFCFPFPSIVFPLINQLYHHWRRIIDGGRQIWPLSPTTLAACSPSIPIAHILTSREPSPRVGEAAPASFLAPPLPPETILPIDDIC